MRANENEINQNKTTGDDCTAGDYMEIVDNYNAVMVATADIAIGADSENNYGNLNDPLRYEDGIPPDYGQANGNQQVSLGRGSRSYGWRCTALGYDAWAGNVSATAVGSSAIAAGTHSVAVGRGAIASLNNSTVIGSRSNRNFWMGCNQANYLDDNGNPIPDEGNLNQQNIDTQLRGPDCGDWRQTPDPTVINKDAGHISICGGVATGSGTSGEVRFKTGTGTPGVNVQQTLTIAGKFDASTGVDTRFLLLDVTTGTIKRVSFGADDSAGAGFKVLRVEN